MSDSPELSPAAEKKQPEVKLQETTLSAIFRLWTLRVKNPTISSCRPQIKLTVLFVLVRVILRVIAFWRLRGLRRGAAREGARPLALALGSHLAAPPAAQPHVLAVRALVLAPGLHSAVQRKLSNSSKLRKLSTAEVGVLSLREIYSLDEAHLASICRKGRLGGVPRACSRRCRPPGRCMRRRSAR